MHVSTHLAMELFREFAKTHHAQLEGLLFPHPQGNRTVGQIDSRPFYHAFCQLLSDHVTIVAQHVRSAKFPQEGI